MPCVENNHTGVVKEEFGCSALVSYTDSNVYLISGLMHLGGGSTKKEGVIVKEIVFDSGSTNLLITNSENFWDLCYNDDCSDPSSEIYISYL